MNLEFTEPPESVLISRTDSIGDVVLTLPLAIQLKAIWPGVKVGFLGLEYTREVVAACQAVDVFISLENFLAEKAEIAGKRPAAILHVFPRYKIAQRAFTEKIPLRIGTRNRWYHWLYCNRLVNLSRRHSPLHEAQLNLKLLEGLNLAVQPGLATLSRQPWLTKTAPLPPAFAALLSTRRQNVILHPRSKGSAQEWPLARYAELAASLDPARYKLFITGTAAEAQSLNPLLMATAGLATDLTGQMNLAQLIAFIAAADGLVACSTGPLHLAASLGKVAIGLYPAQKPMHAGRWAALGPYASVLSASQNCPSCLSKSSQCQCLNSISTAAVAHSLAEEMKIYLATRKQEQ